MARKLLVVFLVCFTGIGLLFATGVAAIAAYYEPSNSIAYGTRVTWTLLTDANMSTEALRLALRSEERLLLLSFVLTIGTVAVSRSARRSVMRSFVCLSQIPFLYWASFGAPMIPVVLAQGMTGESLAEHWPTFIVGALWLAWLIGMVAVSWDGLRVRRRSSDVISLS